MFEFNRLCLISLKFSFISKHEFSNKYNLYVVFNTWQTRKFICCISDETLTGVWAFTHFLYYCREISFMFVIYQPGYIIFKIFIKSIYTLTWIYCGLWFCKYECRTDVWKIFRLFYSQGQVKIWLNPFKKKGLFSYVFFTVWWFACWLSSMILSLT